ncbi:MAG: aminoglycoside phosphotransferase family protein [Marmoricola sp.]
MSASLASLTTIQRDLLADWLPGLRVVRDHGWGLIDNTVLEVEVGHEHFIVKADGDANDHVTRELDAHERWLAPWVHEGRAPRLVAGDRTAKILVTEYLPGELVLGSPAQSNPETFHQAGELLAMLHGQSEQTNETYEAVENAKVLRNLGGAHQIAPHVEARLRETIESWTTEPAVLVPTHGDWQPRNWLVQAGVVRVIDFGRAALRPALSDWLRLEARDFREDRALEAAFLDGYGSDPREQDAWFRERLREAANTAVWAHLVGDRAFEAQGHEMIARVLADG